MTPFGSMYTCSWRPVRYSPSTTRSASAKPRARSPFSIVTSLKTRVDRSGSRTGRSRPVLEAHLGRAQRVAVLVGEEQDRLLGVAHLALDQVGLVVLDERDDVAARDVAVIDQREAGAVEIEVQGRDLAGRDRGADRAPVQHPREAEVVDVARRPAGLGQALLPRDAPAHGPHGPRVPRRAPVRPQAPRSCRQTRSPCRLR